MTDDTKPTAEAGSQPLANVRWEAFCIEYLKDNNATQAYIRAGFKATKAAGPNAARLIGTDIVRARLDNLRRSKLKALHIGADEVLAEIAKIARASLSDAIHITPQGEPYIDLSKAPKDFLDAMSEAVIEDFTVGRGDDARDVRRVKIKMHPKLEALKTIATHHGLTKEKVEVTVTGDFTGKMAAARERMRRAREKKDD